MEMSKTLAIFNEDMKKVIQIEKEIEVCDFCDKEFMDSFGNVYQYDAEEWKHYGAPIGDKTGMLDGCVDCWRKYIKAKL